MGKSNVVLVVPVLSSRPNEDCLTTAMLKASTPEAIPPRRLTHAEQRKQRRNRSRQAQAEE